MENFDEIKNTWSQQPIIEPKITSDVFVAKSLQKIRAQKMKHYWTIGILMSLIFVLLYFYSSVYRNEISNKVSGLTIMIIVIIVRCTLEIVSILKFKQINFTSDFKNYSNQLIAYYKLRKAIHFFFTPLIYSLYIIGFISMLPIFQENLSKGFYLYVLISGFVFLTFFSFLLIKIIKKDLADLKFLQRSDRG
ncbi:MAG: hypothetical protein MUE85_00745 [Microscillaceae bacterium]|jgi:hypothetical protein|nr:hypothetical protein [Microscillaceae bacterium]